MKESYIVAQNAFTISVSEDLSVWQFIRPRFMPFAVLSVDNPVLEIDVRCSELPECDAELIYETVDDGIGFISARASRLPEGSIIMEFLHISDSAIRLWMKMPPELNKAEIIIAPDGDIDDAHILSHAIMIALMLATCDNGTLVIHSSSVIYEGKAYLFQGKSGTGKSTHAALWTKNIPGVELLNDDNPLIRISDDGTAVAYGSPWSGKTHCYRNLSAPIGAFVRIKRDDRNFLQKLPPLKAYVSLTASVFYLPFLSDRLKEIRHKTIERLASTVPCCEMHCLPDADAALVCNSSLLSLQS